MMAVEKKKKKKKKEKKDGTIFLMSSLTSNAGMRSDVRPMRAAVSACRVLSP